jgi:hypothetical protein
MTSQDQRRQMKSYAFLKDHLLRRHRHNLIQRRGFGQVNPSAVALPLGRYLRAARVNAGLSRGELAQQTGLPAGTILALEQGLIIPKEIEPVWLDRLSSVLGEDVGTFDLLLARQPAPVRVRRGLLPTLRAWFSIRRLPGPVYGAVPATLLCLFLGIALFLGVELPYFPTGSLQSLPADAIETQTPTSAINYQPVEPRSILSAERLSLLRAERIQIAASTKPVAQPLVSSSMPVIEHHPVDRVFLLSTLETIVPSQAQGSAKVYSRFALFVEPNARLEGRPNVTNAEFRLENQVLILPKVIDINSEVRQNMVKAETQL